MKTDNKKAIELFEKWYNAEYIKKHKGRSKLIDGTYFDFFLQLPFEMQWGVWVKFFDEQGLFIEVLIAPIDNTLYGKKWDYSLFISNETETGSTYEFDTREQAQKAAIEKALTILNDRL